MRVIEGIGMIVCLIGMAGMDSEKLIYPIAMMVAGAAIAWIAAQFTEME